MVSAPPARWPDTRQTLTALFLDGLAAVPAAGPQGCGAGTRITTADGMIPVEFLGAGDRIVTRAGVRLLRGLRAIPAATPLIRIAPGTLGHDRPERALLIGAGTRVLLRDWRATVLYGSAEALVEAARLIDGLHVTQAAKSTPRLFSLHFDRPEVVYAEGVEIGADPLGAAAIPA